MFEIPNAKRVRREDLYDSSGASGSEAEDDETNAALRSKLNAQLASLLDLDLSVPTQSAGHDGHEANGMPKKESPSHEQPERSHDEDEDEDEATKDDSTRHAEGPQDGEDEEPIEFAFRLFSGEDPSAQKVVLEKQDDADADAARNGGGSGGAFVVARRPTSYYIAPEPSSNDCDRFREAAVSHEYLLADAERARRWGIEKPWKVTTITVTTSKTKTKDGKDVTALVGMIAGSDSKRRTRPGKKRRILLRTREKAKKEKEVVAKQQAVDKEQHLLEKKKRLNRQKKLKRRAKVKEQKQSGDGVVGSHNEDVDDDGESVGSS